MKWLTNCIFFACILVYGITASAETLSGPAPDFTLKSRTGQNVRLKELRGDVILLNFWASWCGPCRQEMPYLEALHRKYKDLGFQVIGINVEEDSSKADAFLSDVPVSFSVLLDKTNSVSELYEVDAMPTTIIIDRDGKKRFLHRGYKPGYEKEYATQVKQLIRE